MLTYTLPRCEVSRCYCIALTMACDFAARPSAVVAGIKFHTRLDGFDCVFYSLSFQPCHTFKDMMNSVDKDSTLGHP